MGCIFAKGGVILDKQLLVSIPVYYFVNELTENIQKAIENLPETYRETFAMSRFGEKTNVQIAEKLGISVKTVEYRISQALKILRLKLKDYLPLLINILG